MKTIESVIYEMMTTSTGKSLGDSGDAYGRHWQRNQRDYPTLESLQKTPSVTIEKPEQWYILKNDAGQFVRRFMSQKEAKQYIAGDARTYTIEKETLDSGDIDYTVNIFHHLTASLDIDETCRAFNTLPCDYWNSEKAYGISLEQEEWLENHGLTIGNTWNSYNGESNLSQALQGANVTENDDHTSTDEWPTYILLQIHQGCDVRGGYTNAKLFKISSDSGYFDTNPVVYGDIDGVQVESGYTGYSLTDENGKPVPVTPKSVISLYLSGE